MADISFYHLSKSPLENALAKLLEKILASNKRAVIWTDTPERMESLNTALWTYSPASFLPHGSAKDGYGEHHPVYLSTIQENPNHATILVTVEGVEVENFDGFERCLDIFNGLDLSSVNEAQERWKHYQQKGHSLTYWYQNETGQWTQKTQF